MKNGKKVILTSILMPCILFIQLSACNTNNNNSAEAVAAALSVAEKYTGAWIAEDGDTLQSVLSDELIGFDAQEAGWSYNKQKSEEMLRNPSFWTDFKVNKGTIFSSQDGRFVAISTTMEFYVGDLGMVPNAHIIAVKDDQVVFAYDYYGGMMSTAESLPMFEAGIIEPGSPEAQKLVKQAAKAMKEWQKAFNDRDVETYLSCYTEDAKYIDIVRPAWRVLSKAELAEDVQSRFTRNAFLSRLEASVKSPITDGFFVSADGHYATAQGFYKDEGISETPMVVILELDAGKIVKQYNYMLVDQSLLLKP